MTAPLTWHVSPRGNDAWSGTQAEPNEAGTDGPFATLPAARDAGRSAGGQPHTVVLSEGRFFLGGSLLLDARDSGLTIAGAGQGKTLVYGGRKLTGWKKDGDRFWSAALPGDQPEWSFRVLVINDTIRDRARYPEQGYLEHQTDFPVRWMSTAGGGWERKPTPEEYTTMVYKEGDIPSDIRIENAEVTICHMWDESTLEVASHDPAARTLKFKAPGAHPPGAFNVHRYAIWNTREGMTHPGQWYLDKVERKVYYWPREGEDMSTALVVAPVDAKIFNLEGKKEARIREITIRDLTLSAGDAPMSQAGFGGASWPGAIHTNDAAELVTVENVEVTNAGVWGVRGSGLTVRNCHLHHLGGGGIKYGGTGIVEGNHIHDVGLVSANCIGIMGGGTDSRVCRNVIHDTPYSGMCVSGTGTRIEENELYRCMQVHHDGAAIYMGGGKKCLIRRNLARDMVQMGSGYGVSAYYLDEKCQECIVEENVAIDIPHPSQNHMTLNCELRNNVFICNGDMKIAFSRCAGHKVTGNVFHLEGQLNVHEPDAITEWRDNLIFTRNEAGGSVLDRVPEKPFVPRDKPRYLKPERSAEPPVIDGRMGPDEWPTGGTSLSERPNQRSVRGAPTSVKILMDEENLYILANVVTMFPEQRKLGREWGVDEGIELAVEGKAGGEKTLYVLHGFSDGTCVPAEVAGTNAARSAEFAKAVQYAAGVEKNLWRSEWAVPLSALGISPGEKILVSFNLTAYRSEDDVYAQYAGTLGDTWDMALAGRLMLNWDKEGKREHPAVSVPRTETPPEAEWSGVEISMSEAPAAVPLSATPCTATLLQSPAELLVRVCIPAKKVTQGTSWRTDDGAEVCIRGKTDGKAATWVVHGFANGSYEVSDEAGVPAAANAAIRSQVRFSALVKDDRWIAEWRLPLENLGVDTQAPVPFNLGVYRTQDRQWINWVGTGGPTWKLENAGTLKLK